MPSLFCPMHPAPLSAFGTVVSPLATRIVTGTRWQCALYSNEWGSNCECILSIWINQQLRRYAWNIGLGRCWSYKSLQHLRLYHDGCWCYRTNVEHLTRREQQSILKSLVSLDRVRNSRPLTRQSSVLAICTPPHLSNIGWLVTNAQISW